MAPVDLVISDWKIIRLTLEDIGPFRQGPQEFDFFSPDHEFGLPGGDGPANLYMLLAKNGRGKTTALETIYGLFGLLNSQPVGRFSSLPFEGRAQLDIRGTWTLDGRTTNVLLSLWTGSDGPMSNWDEQSLSGVAQSQQWARLGINARVGVDGVDVAPDSDELGRLYFDAVRQNVGQPPTILFGESQAMPTVIYFPAHRRVVSPVGTGAVSTPNGWGYQPAQMFDSDGPEWGSSVDNLLVWLEWLDDDRIEELLTFVSDILFRDDSGKYIMRPHREAMRTFVQTRHGIHQLSDLSHGERAILQLMTRLLAHMTSNTIVLIDEIEVHLHSRWMNRLFEAMKELLRRFPAFSIVFTTHSRELLTNFRHNIKEPGLVKAGFLIEDEQS
ncbi:AAA family ATPase [Mesorhizobium sp. M0053]|uniref:AAA family ATPase n=1 Tax=Mesorhizobium sp. M0053 TaxID=2956864 RepID=UPI00333C5122